MVGDVTAIVVQAAPGKEHWTTLQIAWSGVLPPAHVPIFPNLHQERFMAYQAIVAGARGLVFFGGDITKVMSPADAASGWNWTFWHTVLKHVVQELNSTAVGPALVAPPAAVTVKADAADVRVVAREADGFLYLIAVRRSPTAHGPVRFSGLPAGIKYGPGAVRVRRQGLPNRPGGPRCVHRPFRTSRRTRLPLPTSGLRFSRSWPRLASRTRLRRRIPGR